MAEAPLVPPNPYLRTAEPLFWLQAGGQEVRNDTSYFYDARKRGDRPHACLQLTLRGIGFYESSRGRFLLPQNTAFFDIIPGPFKYGYASESSAPYELLFVSFVGPAAMGWYQRITKTFGHVLSFSDDDTIAAQMHQLLRQLHRPTRGDRYLLSSQVYQLLMSVYSAQSKTRFATHPRAASAMHLIAQHASDPTFNITTLADQLDCSREYLSRQFKSAIGLPISDYLLQHRLRLAAHQLRNTTDKLSTIATQSGFTSANYLCRVFKQNVGVTCATFRAEPWLAGP